MSVSRKSAKKSPKFSGHEVFFSSEFSFLTNISDMNDFGTRSGWSQKRSELNETLKNNLFGQKRRKTKSSQVIPNSSYLRINYSCCSNVSLFLNLPFVRTFLWPAWRPPFKIEAGWEFAFSNMEKFKRGCLWNSKNTSAANFLSIILTDCFFCFATDFFFEILLKISQPWLLNEIQLKWSYVLFELICSTLMFSNLPEVF